MKLNDIYINLKKTLDLKQYRSFLWVLYRLDTNKNIENIKNNLEKINLKKVKNIKIDKKNNTIFDWVTKQKIKQKINLKKIVKNSKKLSYKIQDFFTNYHLNFKNKNKTFRLISYIILFFSLLLLDKILIQAITFSWINNLYNVRYTNSVSEIEVELSKAKTKFNIANFLFIPFKLIPEQNIINANNWILTLKDISQFWLNWVEFYKKNINFIKNKKIDDIYFANLLGNSNTFLIESEININSIIEKLYKIKLSHNSNNDSNIEKLESLKNLSSHIRDNLNIINNNFDTFLNILWKDEVKNYFIVFQNNDEIRPTWWFMWSAWIIKIFAWKIKSFEKKDIYAYEWDSKKNYHESVQWPSWINMLSERLGLRDSNAFLNYSESAKSINYFMKKWWYDLDWVIFINQKIILDVLKLVWEIDFQKYKSKITHSNFSEIISLLVEAKVSKKATLDTPKQVLFDFSDLLKDKIIKTKKYSEILKILQKNITTRDIVIYSFNKDENILLEKLNLNWNIDYKKGTDYTFPFFISVWWNKTDRYMKRTYKKKSIIYKTKESEQCIINVDFWIILENTFSKQDENRIIETMEKFRIKQTKSLINIAWAWLNRNYTKTIIPKEAILNYSTLSKYWYTIIEHEKFKTVEKLLETKSWHKSYFNFKYKLEDIDCNNYITNIYKQSWIYNYDLFFDYSNTFTNENENLKLDWLKEDFYYNSGNK